MIVDHFMERCNLEEENDGRSVMKNQIKFWEFVYVVAIDFFKVRRPLGESRIIHRKQDKYIQNLVPQDSKEETEA